MKYASWVPTISGRLSFSRIGKSQFGGLVINRHKKMNGERFYFCAQERNLSDDLFGMSAILRGASSQFIYFFVGNTEDSKPNAQRITGKVYVFAVNEVISDWKAIEHCINSLDDSILDFDVNLCAIYSQLIAVCPVLLHRNGAFSCEINFSKNVIIKKEDFEQADQNYALQVYSFMRDICHNHYHHSPKTDNIIGVFKIENSLFDAPKNRWQMDALHNLLRAVMYRRTSKYSEDLSEALGILHYAEAFYNIFLAERKHKTAKNVTFDKPYGKVEGSDISFKLVEKSIIAKRHNSIQKVTVSGAFFYFMNWFAIFLLPLVALFIAAASTLQIGGEEVKNFILYDPTNGEGTFVYPVANLWKVALLNIYHNPMKVLFVLLVVPFLVLSASLTSIGLSRGNKFHSSTTIRDSTRLAVSLAGMRKSLATALFMIIGLFFVAVAACALYLALSIL